MARPLTRTGRIEVRVTPEERTRLATMAGAEALGPWALGRLLGDGPAPAQAARAPKGGPVPGETPGAAVRRALEELDDGPMVTLRQTRDPMVKHVETALASLRAALRGVP